MTEQNAQMAAAKKSRKFNRVLSGVIAIGCILWISGATTSCGDAKATDKGAATKASGGKANGQLVVKGLYLGMDISEVPALLEKALEEYGTKCKLYEPGEGPYDWMQTKYVTAGKGDGLDEIVATPDSDGKVNALEFSGFLVNALFKAGDMNQQEYAAAFAKAYGIPEWNITDDLDGVYYKSPAGWMVTISPDGMSGPKRTRIVTITPKVAVEKAFE